MEVKCRFEQEQDARLECKAAATRTTAKKKQIPRRPECGLCRDDNVKAREAKDEMPG